MKVRGLYIFNLFYHVGKLKLGSSDSGLKRTIPPELKPLNRYSRNLESPKDFRAIPRAP